MSAGAPHQFRSDFHASTTDARVCRGQGIISLLAGETIGLRNTTTSSTSPVNATSVPSGGTAGVNRSLTLKKLN